MMKHTKHSMASSFSTMNRLGQKAICLSMSLCLLAGSGLVPAFAGSDVLTGDIRVTVNPANLKASVPIAGADRKVTMSFHGIDVKDALRALALKGDFNVLIDDSVEGEVSLELNDVRIQDALETLKTTTNLAYSVQGKNLMVAAADSPKAESFQKTATQIFPLKNANARVLANLLNTTLFADRNAMGGGGSAGGGASSGGGAGGASGGNIIGPVTADFHTNSLIVVGQPNDIKMVEEHLEALDRARETKTWRLSQANVLDVASILSSSLFNEGNPPLMMSSSGSSSSSGGSGGSSGSTNQPSTLRVTAENVSEGTGSSDSSQSGGSSSGSQSSLINSQTLRNRTKTAQTIQVSPTGPILLPDTRLNTLTLMGTAEQIAMAEALIPTLDRKVPQVILEAALVEVKDSARKDLGFSHANNNGHFSSGTNNSPGASALMNRPFSNLIGRSTSVTSPLESIMQWSTNPASRQTEFMYQVNALINQNKAKMLSNPTVVTASDNETIISIVDEIVRSVTITQSALSAPTATVNIGEAGIVLNILPKVGADNTVSLRVRPVISTVAGTEQSLGNIVTLLSKREILTQNVRLHDGETFVLGGLIQNTNKDAVTRSPILSSLPIVGALARNSQLNKERTELLVMITPHIVNDQAEVARSYTNFSNQGDGLQPATYSSAKHGAKNGMLPVSNIQENHPSALPPLEKPRTINASNNSVDRAGSEFAAKPMPLPSGALLPATHRPVSAHHSQSTQSPSMVPVSLKPKATMPASTRSSQSSRVYETSRATPVQSADHPVVQPVPPADISDEAIQAIINKYR